MRAPLTWIREFTPIDAPPADIADALNQLGLEVEEIDDPGREINGVVVARILDVVRHPDADRIRLAEIEFGDGTLRVVCGAPNIEAGMVVPFAPVGAVLPGDLKIERRKIRGVISEGMLCSPRELGLGDDHGGILALPADAPLGADVRGILGLDDVVFDLSITPNRPDAMGIAGVARDLAAYFGTPLRIPVTEPDEVVDALGATRVDVEAPDRCPRFVAMVATVRMGPSPEWMQRRLRLAGMRPISNVVDVTNYVMLERCRPLHAFDRDRLAGRGIVVRTARAGEQMETLDGVVRTLTVEDLLICDAERTPRGIAGVMGGADAEVRETTTEILMESAYFEPSGIAKTAKRLGLRSEASARFERGVDPNGTASGARRAMELLSEVASAPPPGAAIDIYPTPIGRPRITVRTDRVNALLGTTMTTDEIGGLLAPLGIDEEARTADAQVVLAPTFRPDLQREIDIVEEVARRVGLQHIARTVPANPFKIGALTPAQRERRAIADVLVGAGFDETYSLPLLAPTDITRAGESPVDAIEAENPLRAEESLLRPSLLPGLLRAVAHNVAHGEPNVALFEVGTVFLAPEGDSTLPTECLRAAFVRSGVVARRPTEPNRVVTPADAVAALEAVLGELRVREWSLGEHPGHGSFHPARAARVLVDGDPVGTVGEIDPSVCEAFALPPGTVACELDSGRVLRAARRTRRLAPVSRFPASTIDLAFVVDDAVPAAAVRATLLDATGDLAERVELFDVFQADSIGARRVSLAFSVRFRASDRTLTDEEVADLRERAVDAVVRAHGAELRA
ncbi:MAG: phenylalanine--tRNA ligase subunit beta [Actinomycetota bacterium]